MSEASDKTEELKAELPPSNETLPKSPTSRTNFPIEGESRWIGTMRMLALVTLILLVVIGTGLKFLAHDGSFIESQQLMMVSGGIVFLIVIEYFIFLKIVIPRQANYGRYVLENDGVTFFNLSALGLGVSARPQKERIGKFMGVTTGKVKTKKGITRYAVFLVHKTDKGKTININDFNSMQEASQFATTLAQDLGLAVALR